MRRRDLLAAAGLGLASCGRSSDSPLELLLGHVASPGSLVAETADEFARRANEALGGRARVNVFHSSQLGDDDTMLLKLKLGTVDFALPSTIMSSEIGAFGFFEMPYLVSDRGHMKRVGDEVFWPRIAPLAEERGLRIIGLFENGFRQITNNVRPIRVPEDLSDIKLRTPLGRWRVRLFQSYGAHPIPMSMSEVFVALQTGVIDGQENPYTQIYSQKFQEVQRYLSNTNHVYSPAYLTVGQERWASLPRELTARLEGVARGMTDWVLERAAVIDRALLAKLGESGMEVNEADRNAFVAASETIYEEFSNEHPKGREWIRKALALGAS